MKREHKWKWTKGKTWNREQQNEQTETKGEHDKRDTREKGKLEKTNETK